MSQAVDYLAQIGAFIVFLFLVILIVVLSKSFRLPKKDKSVPTNDTYNKEDNKL